MGVEFKSSKKIANIPEALSIYINQLVYSEKRKGIDVITLSLGEAFFDIPNYSFDEINFVQGYHYSDSMGIPELRKRILDYYNNNYNAKIPNISNIMISSGSKAIIYMIMQSTLNVGDEVLIHEPAWLSYREQVKLVGAIPQFIPYDCEFTKITDYLTEKTKLLVLNNPNNPSGRIYSSKQLEKIYIDCYKRGIYILMDEAYSDFIEEKNDFCSLASVAKNLDGVFIVNSLSKNMGMSGWRIGYVIANEDKITNLLKLNQHIITCAPTILQLYIAHYFEDIINVTLPQIKEVVQKRKRIIAYMDFIGLKYMEGISTFYIFVKMEGLKSNTLDFCLYLLFKYGISTVPGDAYGMSTNDFIRISIGTESEERIKYSLDIIKSVLNKNLTDKVYVAKKLENNGFHRFGGK